jgi:hypothetical protein
MEILEFVKSRTITQITELPDFQYYHMSEWLFNVNSAIFQLYHGENKLIFNEMMMMSALFSLGTLVSSTNKTKDYKIDICCFSAKHAALKERAKTGWLGIRIMCPSGATCLSADCCFSELALCKS